MFYFKIQRMKDKSNRDSELASYKIELGNQVTQNDATLPVTNSKIFCRNYSFELLTRLHKILN